MLLPDLHPLMFSSLFPFVNPYQSEGVNQAIPDSLDLLLSEGGARSCTPSRPNYLVLTRAGFAIYGRERSDNNAKDRTGGTTSCIVRRSGCSE